MQFLRTLFWVVVAVAAVLFAVRNWSPVTVNLWAGLQADVKLPVLVYGAFLAGLLPPYILHKATRWRLKRRLEASERALTELRGPVAAAPMPDPLLPAETPVALPPVMP